MATKITAAIAGEKERLRTTLYKAGLKWGDGKTRLAAVGNSNKDTFKKMLVWTRKEKTPTSSSENKG